MAIFPSPIKMAMPCAQHRHVVQAAGESAVAGGVFSALRPLAALATSLLPATLLATLVTLLATLLTALIPLGLLGTLGSAVAAGLATLAARFTRFFRGEFMRIAAGMSGLPALATCGSRFFRVEFMSFTLLVGCAPSLRSDLSLLLLVHAGETPAATVVAGLLVVLLSCHNKFSQIIS